MSRHRRRAPENHKITKSKIANHKSPECRPQNQQRPPCSNRVQPQLGAIARAGNRKADEERGREQAMPVELREPLFDGTQPCPPPRGLDDRGGDGAVAFPIELEVPPSSRRGNPTAGWAIER